MKIKKNTVEKNTPKEIVQVKESNIWILSCVFLFLITVGYIYIVTKYTENIPFGDDYDLLNGFNKIIETDNFLEKFILFYSQHSEHRIVFTKFIFLLSFLITGTINFKFIAIVGNIGVLLITILLSYSIFDYKNKQTYLYLLPVFLFLLQICSWEFLIWPMSSVQNTYVLFFAFVALFLLSKDKIYLALFFAFLSTFTSGNGFLTFIAGFGILFLLKSNYKSYLIWAIFFMITMSLYFYSYKESPHHPSIIKALTENPKQLISYFFTFCGSIYQVIFQKSIALKAGIASMAILVFLIIFLKLKNIKIEILGYLFFLLLTSAVISLSRSGFGVEQALGNRYVFYSIIYLTLTYIILMSYYKNSKFSKTVNLFFIFISIIYSYKSYSLNIFPLNNMSYVQKAGVISYNENFNDFFFPELYNGAVESRPILKKAEKLNSYNFPPISLNDIKSSIVNISVPIEQDNNINQGFEIIEFKNYHIVKFGWAFIIGKNSNQSTIYTVLTSDDNKKYVFETKSNYSMEVANHFQTILYQKCGFTFILNKKDIPKGNYKVGILIENDNKKSYVLSDKVINV